MSAKFEAANPDKIPFTLTVTLTLDEWQLVRKRLNGTDDTTTPIGYPLLTAIADMVRQAIDAYYPNSKVFE